MLPFRQGFDGVAPRTLTVCWVALGWMVIGILPSNAASDEIVGATMQGVVAIYKASTEEKNKPSGTGFFITPPPDGYLLTASHVVEQDANQYKGATFRLKLSSGRELDARLIARNQELDVALLKTLSPSDASLLSEVKPLPLKQDSKDTHLIILGHPSGDRPKLFDHTNVTVSNTDRYGLEAVSPASDAGYSGGPVIDVTGSVVGIALQQAGYSPVDFVRRVDTLSEFLEANEIVQGSSGYARHLLLSSLATIEQVETLETKLNDLKDEERKKQRLIDEITKQLWNLKSQVQWNLSICEIPSSPKEIHAPGLPKGLHADPKHRLTIGYNKILEIMFDAEGVFTVSITPLMAGEAESQKGQNDARKRRLYVAKSVTFDGQKWVFEQLDDDVEAQVRNYNETRDLGSIEVDDKNIDSFMVSLKPPQRDDEMKFFGFPDKVVKFAGVKKCDVEQ